MSLEPRVDPAADRRANYDYRSEDVDRPALVADLERVAGCSVRADSYSRQLYATDASAYEVTPIAVAFPESTADVAAVLEYCSNRGIPVLPRGGGTSLAGQTVNRAVVLDFTRHMNDILEVDPDTRTATVQPGTILGTLNETLAAYDLKFAPDPAWGDKSAIGGAIGNNSTGSHSLKYGKTDAYLESAEVVLADGTVTEFGEVTLEELAERADPEGDLEGRIYAKVDHILDEESDLIDDATPISSATSRGTISTDSSQKLRVTAFPAMRTLARRARSTSPACLPAAKARWQSSPSDRLARAGARNEGCLPAMLS